MLLHQQRRNQLYRLRRNRGLRQKHLAMLLGYRSTSQVSRLETGSALPSLKVALLLQLALGAQITEAYIDLHAHLRSLLIKRASRLPPSLSQSLRSRLLREE